MGALVAALNKRGENVVPTVVDMLNMLKYRGTDGHGVSTATSIATAQTLEQLNSNITSNVALGHNLSRIVARDNLQPVQGNGFTFVFEGHLYPAPNLPGSSEPKELVEKLASNPLNNASNIIENMDGSYVFAVAQPNRIIAGRDLFGATPLYYGENQSICALASERKALWHVGLENVQTFPPGQIAVIDQYGFSFRVVKTLRNPPKTVVDMETAAEALQLLLLDSTRRQVSDLERVAVAFSGGVDSSVVAVLAKNVGLNIQLIAVGLENQPDVQFAQQAAEALVLPIHIQTYSTDELKETLMKALWLIEEPHSVNACIAIPFYWLAETASKLGYHVLLAGQGADELFGGYQRYVIEYKQSGKEAVEKTMFQDVMNAYRANFQRDNQICSFHKVELRLPFIDRHVVDFALRLPLSLKLNSVDDPQRKRVLRRVAHNLDIPSFVADKPKKAVQYTTGVTKALQHIAKNEGYTLREIVNKAFNNIYPSQDRFK